MTSNLIDITNNECKKGNHASCVGSWIGFGFEFFCDCNCHLRKNNAADDFREPHSAASSQCTLEVTKEND
jgi:hypothetical protein